MFVEDWTNPTRKYGPAAYRPDIAPEHIFNLRDGNQPLNETASTYQVMIYATPHLGDSRRVFKGRVVTPFGDD